MIANDAGNWRCALAAALLCAAPGLPLRDARADFSSVPLTNNAPVGAVGGVSPFAPPRGPLANTAQRPHPAVVRVVVPMRDGTSYGSGTLVDVSETQGLVITNWHVVEEQAGPITVVFPDGFRSHATIMKADKTWDLAALSIWKPTVAPVSIAKGKPQKGDVLSIAGYGNGNYRMVTGRCTQYVSPYSKAINYPAEMVELSAAARQGDSGGPILNQNGELAGVLFGEGGGRTAGSYCGRVADFLASVRLVDNGAVAQNRATLDANSPLLGGAGPAKDGRIDGWRAEDQGAVQTPARSAAFGGLAAGEPADPMAGRIAAGANGGGRDRASAANAGAQNYQADPRFAGQTPTGHAPAGGASAQGSAPASATGSALGAWGWNPGARGPGPGDVSARLPPAGGMPNGGAAGWGQMPGSQMPGSANGGFSASGNSAMGVGGTGGGITASTPGAAPAASEIGDRLAMLGATRFEQGKSIFALIGIAAAVLLFSRVMGRGKN